MIKKTIGEENYRSWYLILKYIFFKNYRNDSHKFSLHYKRIRTSLILDNWVCNFGITIINAGTHTAFLMRWYYRYVQLRYYDRDKTHSFKYVNVHITILSYNIQSYRKPTAVYCGKIVQFHAILCVGVRVVEWQNMGGKSETKYANLIKGVRNVVICDWYCSLLISVLPFLH